jgi:predicted amidohydrolase YtcJ
MRRAWVIGASLVAVLAAATSATAAVRPADTVLRHGVVYTVDRHDSIRQALAIRHGRIVFVGSNSGVRRYIGPRTRVLDLNGKMVMPGLQDSHIHALPAGSRLLECDLNYEPLTISEFQRRIQACLDKTKDKEPDGYLTVVGWYRQAMQPPGTEVSKVELDALTTRRPIVVQSTDGHTVLANSRAIALAGVTRSTPDPPSGQIKHDAVGEPSGIFEDAAGELITGKIPLPTRAENVAAAAAALDELRREGVTAFMAQIAPPPEISAFATLARRHRLTARAYMAPDLLESEYAHPRKAVDRILALKRKFDTGPLGPRANLWVRHSGEIFQDGVIQWPAQTASLLEPYLVNAGTDANPKWVPGPSAGPDPYTPSKVLRRVVVALGRADIDPEIHAIGDRAVRHVLDVYAYARKRLRGRDTRLQIAHAELVAPSDIPRFRKLRVTADMGFQWAKPAYDSIDAAEDFLGPKRFNRMEPEGYLYRAGARISQGSDWPVDPLDQWFAMEVLMTRRGELGGKYAGRLGTVPGVPLRGALRAFTMNGAYALHSEHQTGSLERGKLADLIVLNQNLLKVPARRISETKVLRTIVGGRSVYRAR